MESVKNLLFSEREYNSISLSMQLLDKMRRIVDLDAPFEDKILQIRDLIKHYAKIGRKVELFNTEYDE